MMMKANDSILPSHTSNMAIVLRQLGQELLSLWQLCRHIAVSQWDPEQERRKLALQMRKRSHRQRQH
ncbi:MULTISPECIES: hypothetical protein [Rheinheimera]|uniref:Uncharacterized protein n=1 Tax=Rheinheimera tilapiae TaxID=875043 RepID=A0ABV6BIQ6_9GAMM